MNASKMLFLTVLLLPIRYPIMFLYSMGCLPIIHMIIHSILYMYSIVSIICVGRKCANHLKDQEIYIARSLISYVMFCRSLFVIVSCFLWSLSYLSLWSLSYLSLWSLSYLSFNVGIFNSFVWTYMYTFKGCQTIYIYCTIIIFVLCTVSIVNYPQT